MKKIITLTLAVILMTLTLTSCGKEIIAVMPAYRGEPVTDTHHEFTKEDFYVLVRYDDGTDEEATEYEFEIKEMSGGYYVLEFTVKDFVEEAYVPIDVPVYPSDKK